MPVGTLLLNKEVKRSPSLRSEQSSLSDSRHVSFNQDVSIKRIPKKPVKPSKSLPLDPNDEFTKKCHGFVNIPPPSDREKIADEAEEILRQLDDIECSVSPSPRISSPVRQIVSPSPQGGSRQNTPYSSRQNTLERGHTGGLTQRLSKSSSDLLNGGSKHGSHSDNSRAQAMRVDGHSEQEDNDEPGGPHNGQENRFYGLQALSNLDNAVNGAKLNNLQQERSGSVEYSHPSKRNNFTPPKPPRKAPSSSPPSLRKSYTSHENLDLRDDMRKQYQNQMEDIDPNGRISYTGTNPSLYHLRNSPIRQMNSRQSPSHGNHTDSEILSSPTQVLYATISADKHKHNGNLKNQHIQTQTTQTGFRPVSADRQMKSRTSSRENILDDPHYRQSNGADGPSKYGSRSLERFVEDDKENHKKKQELKARIHVKSPMRYPPERPGVSNSRKPYKTTINTATDTIQYKGFSSENLAKQKGNMKNHGKKVDTEHYKVPKNKAPVPADFIARKGKQTDMENTSTLYNNGHPIPKDKNSNSKSQFASTSLVRNVESRQKRGEYDREGRRIQSDRMSTERNRAYSGYSTSPDRERSPDRYAKPRSGKIQLTHRSPSTSPTRPPRTRASPNREIHIPIRQEHSGREIERSPSTRATATSRSPIKKIQRVQNEFKGDREQSPHQSKTLTLTRNKGDKIGARGVKTMLGKKEDKREQEVDRLSKFTEYRGGSEDPTSSATSQRRGSTGHELKKDFDHNEFDRERGQSVPPGVNIDSMRDFYKSTQYRSMYHLPPSPSRPAPILDRGSKTQTLERSNLATMQRERSGDLITAPPRRLAKTSISEGEVTDDPARQERANRHRNKFLNNIVSKSVDPNQAGNRRVVSGERGTELKKNVKNNELNNARRNGSNDRQPRRPAPQPPTQKVRRSSVDVLTSHSESESPRPDQAALGVEAGSSRWVGGGNAGQSDLEAEADYRRDLATSSGSVHMEARTRDGVIPAVTAPPSIYQQAATLSRNKSGSRNQINMGVRGRSGERREVEISQDDDEDEVVRAPNNLSREEERRKIIELEEERRKKEMKIGNVSRSGSKASKIAGAKVKIPKFNGTTETENESQYSGHSSSSIKDPVNLKNRYNTTNTRVKRTGSTATSGSARQVISRKKMPGSVTSSINSSESENGAQSGISRATNQSGGSNRSVYLHATAVAEIPSRKPVNALEEQGGSNLQKSKKISRSISLLAPFKKQPVKEKEVIYDSSGQITNSHSGKPPRAPPPPTRRVAGSAEPALITKDRKFASSSDLLQDENDVSMSSGYSEKAPVPAKQTAKVSRSVSMPKDTRLAGWFKKRKKVQ